MKVSKLVWWETNQIISQLWASGVIFTMELTALKYVFIFMLFRFTVGHCINCPSSPYSQSNFIIPSINMLYNVTAITQSECNVGQLG